MKVIKVGSTSQSRIAQACDRCRSKKIRCDGVRPCCSQCAIVGFECRTSDKLSRRAFPRGYTETLEERVRSLEAEVRELKHLIDQRDEKIDLLIKGGRTNHHHPSSSIVSRYVVDAGGGGTMTSTSNSSLSSPVTTTTGSMMGPPPPPHPPSASAPPPVPAPPHPPPMGDVWRRPSLHHIPPQPSLTYSQDGSITSGDEMSAGEMASAGPNGSYTEMLLPHSSTMNGEAYGGYE
ncbi:MAG: hypothetical protein M1823_006118, partial [Watsoniomyces obsoletus]